MQKKKKKIFLVDLIKFQQILMFYVMRGNVHLHVYIYEEKYWKTEEIVQF